MPRNDAPRHHARRYTAGVLAVAGMLAPAVAAEVAHAGHGRHAEVTAPLFVSQGATVAAGMLAMPTPEQQSMWRMRSFPAETSPASSVTGLVTGQNVVADVPATVAISPAMRARLDAEGRAARAAERAQLDARAGHARPVEGARLSSGFGARWGRMHAGLDFAGPVGLTIRAVAAGTVTTAEEMAGYGRIIEIEHPDGHFSRYAHLERIRVEVGDEIEPAQDIGALGNTGRSTGPHLHLEIRKADGSAVDPMPWLEERGIVPFDPPEESDAP